MSEEEKVIPETPKTPKDKALSKPQIYKEFVIWMALPEPLRALKTQGEFAKKFGVSPDTLSDWKKRDGFWGEVEEEWRHWGKVKTSNVIARFYTKVMGPLSKTSDFKLWLQYFLDWSEKFEGKIDHGGGIRIIHTYPEDKKDERHPS